MKILEQDQAQPQVEDWKGVVGRTVGPPTSTQDMFAQAGVQTYDSGRVRDFMSRELAGMNAAYTGQRRFLSAVVLVALAVMAGSIIAAAVADFNSTDSAPWVLLAVLMTIPLGFGWLGRDRVTYHWWRTRVVDVEGLPPQAQKLVTHLKSVSNKVVIYKHEAGPDPLLSAGLRGDKTRLYFCVWNESGFAQAPALL